MVSCAKLLKLQVRPLQEWRIGTRSRFDKISILWYAGDNSGQERGMPRMQLIVVENLNNRRPSRKPVYPSG